MSHSLSTALRTVSIFADFTPAQLEAVAAVSSEVVYPANAILFCEDDPGDTFYIILEGEVGIYKAMNTPNELLFRRSGAGDFLGEMGLLSGEGLRSASVRAERDTRMAEMTRGQFEALLLREPSVAYKILAVVSRRLNEANNIAIQELTEKNQKLAQAYADLQAAQAQIIEKKLMDQELSQAREIQRSMLPHSLPRLEGINLGARMLPAQMVGGDFYDVIYLDADHLGVAIGDVSGKGIPAALFMALTTSLLRAEASPDLSPLQVLTQVNQHLKSMNSNQMFVTMTFGIIELSTRRCSLVRAGHELPLLLDAAGNVLPLPQLPGQLLGLFNFPELELQTFDLPPGGTLLLYTDGVTEARNAPGEFFGEQRLESLAPGLRGETAQGLCDRLLQAVLDFSAADACADDITLLAVKITGK